MAVLWRGAVRGRPATTESSPTTTPTGVRFFDTAGGAVNKTQPSFGDPTEGKKRRCGSCQEPGDVNLIAEGKKRRLHDAAAAAAASSSAATSRALEEEEGEEDSVEMVPGWDWEMTTGDDDGEGWDWEMLPDVM